MPKQTRIPTYRRHKGSGQAVVVLAGRSVYLGKWGSSKSRAEYERVISEWLLDRQRLAQRQDCEPLGPPAANLSIGELILAFCDHARTHYRDAEGKPTGELDNLRHALRPVRRLYGHTRARDFGPL